MSTSGERGSKGEMAENINEMKPKLSKRFSHQLSPHLYMKFADAHRQYCNLIPWQLKRYFQGHFPFSAGYDAWTPSRTPRRVVWDALWGWRAAQLTPIVFGHHLLGKRHRRRAPWAGPGPGLFQWSRSHRLYRSRHKQQLCLPAGKSLSFAGCCLSLSEKATAKCKHLSKGLSYLECRHQRLADLSIPLMIK